MNEQSLYVPFSEPERYELHDEFALDFEFDRRDLLRMAGSGIVVACLLRDAAAQPPRRRPGGAGASRRDRRLAAHRRR